MLFQPSPLCNWGAQKMIKPPSSETPSKIQNNKRWHPYFKVSTNIALQIA
jgi:hypothetical protein